MANAQRSKKRARKRARDRERAKRKKQKAAAQAQHLVLSGPIVGGECRFDLFISEPGPDAQPNPINAVIDTGCTGIAIRSDVAAALALRTIGHAAIRTASGTEHSPVAVARLYLHSKGRTVTTVTEVIVQDQMADEMLFGMRGMAGGVLRVDLIQDTWELRIKEFGPSR